MRIKGNDSYDIFKILLHFFGNVCQQAAICFHNRSLKVFGRKPREHIWTLSTFTVYTTPFAVQKLLRTGGVQSVSARFCSERKSVYCQSITEHKLYFSHKEVNLKWNFLTVLNLGSSLMNYIKKSSSEFEYIATDDHIRILIIIGRKQIFFHYYTYS